jgi:hypothetical protein
MIRANAVQVAKFFQAYCRIEGCDYLGDQTDSYQEADAAREEHLNEHRAEEKTA